MVFTKPVNMTTVQIQRVGHHPNLGLELKNDDRGPIITHCKRGTPAAKIQKCAIKKVFMYLNATFDDGLIFWRPQPYSTLPTSKPSVPAEDTHNLHIPTESHSPTTAYGYTDSDLAGDTKTRKSVSGVTIIFGGAAAVYKTILQRTIALSSTEAEFYALTEAGKSVLYVHHVLKDLHLEQTEPTTINEDNHGCLQMTVLRKATGRIIFYRHNDTLLGKRIPKYVQSYT